MTWIGAANLGFDVAVGYYGGGIAASSTLSRNARSNSISATRISHPDGRHRQDQGRVPDVPTYVYEGAGHGFACDERASFDEAATKTSRERTNAFLAENM